MKILKTTDLLKNHNDICLVPTMGALHDGHISLIHKAKETGLKIVVSIFVNKLQFNDEQDFVNYPRDIEKDIKILNDLDVDFAFIPDEETIYPKSGFENLYSGNVGNKYEGSSRPGHFDGVLTIVNRLFQLIRPHTVIFGSKDIQQLFFIKKLITFKLGLGALERNTIFFECFFNWSTASIAFGLRATPLCITPHKSITKVSYSLNISAKWFSSLNLLVLSF